MFSSLTIIDRPVVKRQKIEPPKSNLLEPVKAVEKKKPIDLANKVTPLIPNKPGKILSTFQ